MFRSSSSEVFSKIGALQTRSKPTGEQQAQTQHICSATLLKSPMRMDTPPKICSISASAERPPPGEYLWGTASACQKNFKRLKVLKVFIYSC